MKSSLDIFQMAPADQMGLNWTEGSLPNRLDWSTRTLALKEYLSFKV